MLERFKYPLLVVVALAIVGGIIALLSYRPNPVVITVNPPLPTVTPSPIRIYMTGAVNLPLQTYELPFGSRVEDAIKAAGGFTQNADQTSINLARVLQDGEHLHVLEMGTTADTTTNSTPLALTSTLININIASSEDLQRLPGCGPELAQAIIDYRTQNGSFRSLDDLDKVTGIGPVTLERWQPLITFG